MEEAIKKRNQKLIVFKKLFEELLQDLETIKPGDPSLLLVKTAVSFLNAETSFSSSRPKNVPRTFLKVGSLPEAVAFVPLTAVLSSILISSIFCLVRLLLK